MALGEDDSASAYAVMALTDLHERKARSVIVRRLKDDNFCIKLDCLLYLTTLGDNKVKSFLLPRLRRDLRSKDLFVRREAIEHLATLRDRSSVRELRHMLKDKDHITSIVAADALLILGDRTGMKLVREGLNNGASHLRLFSLEALEGNGAVNSLDTSIEVVLRDSDFEVRYAAASFLNKEAPAGTKRELINELKKSAGISIKPGGGDAISDEVLLAAALGDADSLRDAIENRGGLKGARRALTLLTIARALRDI